jgi:microcompartment protein CcmK/EutM
MIPAQVVGHAVSSHGHPSLKGRRLLLCQPLDGTGLPAGEPMLAIDVFGAGLHSRVFVSTDGIGARHLVHDERSPVRNFVQGIIDD